MKSLANRSIALAAIDWNTCRSFLLSCATETVLQNRSSCRIQGNARCPDATMRSNRPIDMRKCRPAGAVTSEVAQMKARPVTTGRSFDNALRDAVKVQRRNLTCVCCRTKFPRSREKAASTVSRCTGLIFVCRTRRAAEKREKQKRSKGDSDRKETRAGETVVAGSAEVNSWCDERRPISYSGWLRRSVQGPVPK